jgi:hypothetical protein
MWSWVSTGHYMLAQFDAEFAHDPMDEQQSGDAKRQAYEGEGDDKPVKPERCL